MVMNVVPETRRDGIRITKNVEIAVIIRDHPVTKRYIHVAIGPELTQSIRTMAIRTMANTVGHVVHPMDVTGFLSFL